MLMNRYRVKYTYAEVKASVGGADIAKGSSEEDVCLGYDEAHVMQNLINGKNLYSLDFIQEIDENGDLVYKEED